MRNKLKKIMGTVMVLCLLLGVLAALPKEAQASRIIGIPKTKGVTVGKKTMLAHDENGKATWKVIEGQKNIKLIKEKENSVTIKGIKPGTAKVQAVIGNKKAVCIVKIFEKVHTLTYNGKNASQIKKEAYEAYNAGAETKIVVKDGVKSIEKKAFQNLDFISDVKIPDSVTSIGEYAFGWCSTLKSVKIPDSVTSIGKGAFQSCSSLKSITIPSGVKSISSNAFYGCGSLSDVTISDGVESIEKSAFVGCRSLESINIPDSVTEIESLAFDRRRSSNLKSITWKGTTYTNIDDFTRAFRAANTNEDTDENADEQQ